MYNWEIKLNRRFLGYSGKGREVVLEEEKALETFADFFVEVIVLHGILGYLTFKFAVEKHKEGIEETARR